MQAFLAIARDYPDMGLEMDVQQLADGKLVVFHDMTVDRVAAGGERGPVASFTTAQWKNLRITDPLGGPPAPAAFLDEVFQEFGGTGKILLIEQKAIGIRDAFIEAVWPYREQVIAVPRGYGSPDARIFSGSGLYTQLPLKDETTPMVDGLNCVVVNAAKATKALCNEAHNRGARVWVWGVGLKKNDPALLAKGVDGFIVDDPAL